MNYQTYQNVVRLNDWRERRENYERGMDRIIQALMVRYEREPIAHLCRAFAAAKRVHHAGMGIESALAAAAAEIGALKAGQN